MRASDAGICVAKRLLGFTIHEDATCYFLDAAITNALIIVEQLCGLSTNRVVEGMGSIGKLHHRHIVPGRLQLLDVGLASRNGVVIVGGAAKDANWSVLDLGLAN